jgi:hypothetical protein
MPIVEHFKDGKTEYYLEVIFLKPGAVEYFLDGQHINKADIIGLNEKADVGQAGLDNAVIIRSFKAESVTAVRIDGTEWI